MQTTGTRDDSAFSARRLIDNLALEYPDGQAFVFPETARRTTWQDLRDAARDFARHISAMGIARGESVAYMAHNGYAAIVCLFGCLYGGWRATPVNLVTGPEAVGYVLSHSRSRIVLIADEHRQLLREALHHHPAELTIVPLDPDNGVTWPDDCLPGDLPASPDAGTIGLLMYTSGTTGRPKGVLHSHASLLAGGHNTAIAHGLGPNDTALCVLPLYHINGLCVTVMAPLVSRGSVIIPHRFSKSRFWRLAGEYRATWFSVVPTIISHLLHASEDEAPDDATKARIRFGRSASAPLSPEVHAAFEQRFAIPIIETMGLTETAAQILSNPLPPYTRKLGSPGIAVGNEVMIADNQQNPLPAGTQGEVLVRGTNVMQGYLDNPEATADAITDTGWFRTGDLGHMDEDGYVFITGRLKELIIKGGENIAPREIDEALLQNPAVIEAAAFARPCDTYGQRVEACVVVAENAGISEADLIAQCRARLGDFKCPERVHFMAELPKGPSGKIQRRLLCDLV